MPAVCLALLAAPGRPLAAESEGEESEATDAPVAIPTRRYTFVAAGVLAAAGAGFAYLAQGDADRAKSVTTARDAQRAVQNARASAATANALYTVAGVVALYGVVLELLPEDTAQKASLTFHF